jgi:Zn-finger nucleic acid-binding protein
MKCSSCGAFLPEGLVICPFCKTDNAPGQTLSGLAEVNEHTTHGEDSPRQCPCCSITLSPINLATQGSYMIDICTRCRGLFFDTNELEAMLLTLEQNTFHIDYAQLVQVESFTSPLHLRYGRPCPVCRQAMQPRPFAGDAKLPLDNCDRHGIWVDGGLLPKLIEWKKAGGRLTPG